MKAACSLLLAAIFCAAFGYYVWQGVQDGGLQALPELGDGHDYDAIAFNLWKYHRFGYDWDNLAWREPYLNHADYQDLLNRHSSYYPTTYRPPAVPLLMAAVYTIAGRRFAAWRLVSCALTAGAVTGAAALSASMAGLAAAPVAAIIAMTLPLPTLLSYQFMTEGLAAFLVAWLAWRLAVNQRHGWTIANAIGAGLLLGATMATRSLFALLLPIAFLAPGKSRATGVRRWWLDRGVCVLTALLVMTPWWVRNTIVLHAFMPLGTQGAVNLPAGFGPRAIRFEGMWAANPGDGEEEVEALNLGPVEGEVWLARFRSQLTFRWMRTHPADVLRLMWLHVWQEVRPRNDPTGAWLLPAAMVAAFFLRASPIPSILMAITAANLLAVALTWSAAGRFVVPAQPMLSALPAALAVVLTRRAFRRSGAGGQGA